MYTERIYKETGLSMTGTATAHAVFRKSAFCEMREFKRRNQCKNIRRTFPLYIVS